MCSAFCLFVLLPKTRTTFLIIFQVHSRQGQEEEDEIKSKQTSLWPKKKKIKMKNHLVLKVKKKKILSDTLKRWKPFQRRWGFFFSSCSSSEAQLFTTAKWAVVISRPAGRARAVNHAASPSSLKNKKTKKTTHKRLLLGKSEWVPHPSRLSGMRSCSSSFRASSLTLEPLAASLLLSSFFFPNLSHKETEQTQKSSKSFKITAGVFNKNHLINRLDFHKCAIKHLCQYVDNF